jgi:molybdopterin molybdotransferase
MSGRADLERPSVQVVMQEEIHSDGRQSYIRAVVTKEGAGYTAVTTGGQGSHMMTSLVRANALVVVPEGVKYVGVGERLTALMIDWPEHVF